jgi:alkylhydroperoxidase family enzyme
MTSMPRLRPLGKDEVPAEVRPILEAAERTFGVPSVSLGIRAYCPPILEASQALGAAPAKSGLLSAQLRGLVQLRAAQIVRCPF